MNDQMILNPWLPDFLQDGLQYTLWLEMLQYLLFIVLAIAVFTLVCALVDLVLLLREEGRKTQPLSILVMKAVMRWLDTHVTHLPLWRAVTARIHAASNVLHHARHLRFPH
jgi:hypothetical protein